MRLLPHTIIAVIALLNLCAPASAELLFPPPEFESGYLMPSTTTPHPHQDVYEYVDVAVLFVALSLASYIVLKKRSRRATFVLMILSLIYFGFWRKGCVCPIGAIQNVVLSIFDATYAVPIAVLLFFLLPLVFTLFFGRVFCAAVCPLGAIQDLVLLRPASVPYWLASGLRVLAYLYLGLAVLFAATGSAFLICRYDPFVAFFRFSGNVNILIIGVCFLLVGLFIGRPYCRFFCPYGIILRQLSRLSKWQVTITPDECIQCRLCEDSCPFGAIRSPAVQWPAVEYDKAKKRLAFLILLMPVLILLCGWTGSRLKNVTSRMHPTVRLAERIYLEEAGDVNDITDPSTAFRATGETIESLYQRASVIRERFTLGGWLLGAFLGLVIGVKLIAVSVWRKRTDYEADRAGCLACARCFKYCPRERLRLSKTKKEFR
ncbi:MAG: 4Fe-4S binding protein [Sedimentisphaerales bacterium]|nr:4Fe-4S binding protein [Sedimentisphaerales bacterium]